MPRTYVVKQGDDLYTIAGQLGFADETKIVAANSDLTRKPGILHPGDELQIPDIHPKALSASEKSTNKFKLASPKRVIKFPLQDDAGNCIAGAKFTIVFGGDKAVRREGTTDSTGMIEAELPWRETEAILVLEHSTIRLRLGHLNPVADADDGGRSGVAQRLALLGFHPGPLDGSDRVMLANALVSFQRANKLTETWEADPGTVKKLDQLAVGG